MYYQPMVVYRNPDEPKKNSIIRYIGNRVINSNKNFLCAVTGMTGAGKCQPVGSKVLMADGSWKNVEDIKIGDLVISPQEDGTNIFSVVKGLSSWFCDNTYDVVQLNRKHQKLYSCSNNHLIPVYNKANNRKTINGKRVHLSSIVRIKNYEADKLFNMSSSARGHNNIAFSSFPIRNYLGKPNCVIEPYTLGAFLGDGMFYYKVHSIKNDKFQTMKRSDKKEYHQKICSRLSIEASNKEVINYISNFYPIKNICKKNKDCGSKSYEFGTMSILAKQLELSGLKGLNSGNKFIPKEALTSNLEYRKRLLAGLIDTDGYYSHGGYSFTLKSKRLIEDIRDLVYSIGGRCYGIKKVIKKIKSIGFSGEYYSLSFYLGDLRLPLLSKHKIKTIKSSYLNSNRIAIDLVKGQASMVYGFELDSPSNLYITDNWMITHNSYACLAMAEEYAKMYNIPFDPAVHVISSLKELLTLIVDKEVDKKIRDCSVIVFDEPQVENNARNWQSDMNQAFSQLISTFRNQRLVVFFATPYLEMIDKQSRILFHGEFKVLGFDKTTGITKIKPRFLEYNRNLGDFYRKRLIIQYATKDKRALTTSKLNFWHINKASKDTIYTYELKKKKFTDDLNRRLLNQIELAEKQAEGKNKSDELFKVKALYDEYGENYISILQQMPHLTPFTLEKYLQFIKKTRKTRKLGS